jgi:hypothetical protein
MFPREAIYVGFPKVLNFGGGAIWLARRAGEAGGPSLRLKSGYAQDDAEEEHAAFFKLTHYPAVSISQSTSSSGNLVSP